MNHTGRACCVGCIIICRDLLDETPLFKGKFRRLGTSLHHAAAAQRIRASFKSQMVDWMKQVEAS